MVAKHAELLQDENAAHVEITFDAGNDWKLQFVAKENCLGFAKAH